MSRVYCPCMTIRTCSGTVQKGEGRASTLGFPTVNIPLPDADVSGVFAGVVRHKDREYHAAIFADPPRGLLEAYLLDFDEDLYGQEVSMTLLRKLRDSKPFSSDEELRVMIGNDVEAVRRYLTKLP